MAGARSYEVVGRTQDAPEQRFSTADTSFSPPSLPGHTVSFRVRAHTPNAVWSRAVKISYPSDGGSVSVSERPEQPRQGTTPAASTPTQQGSAAPHTEPAVPNDGQIAWGINANTQGWGEKMGSMQDLINQLGVGWIREQINWSTVEPSPGHWDWTSTDALFTDASERDLNVLPLLMLTPDWAGAAETEIPSDPSGYAEFVSQVVKRYGPHGSFWSSHPQLNGPRPAWFELWNEPYYEYFADGHVEAARYARLIAAAGAAGHSADPEAKFLLEAVNRWYNGSRWLSWVNSMYKAVPNLNDYFDGVAVHPYGSSFTDPTETNGFYQDIHELREQFVSHGAGEKPFWITEVGYSTCATGASAGCYSEAEQAHKYSELISLVKTTYSSYVRGVLFYSYMDLQAPESEAENAQAHYGLVHSNGSPKPAYSVIQSAVGS